MKRLKLSTKPSREKDITRSWHLVNLEDKVLGRAATEIARLIEGKHKVTYAPYLDIGDYVVVINAKKVVISGKKAQTKVYTRYSGYPGGLRTVSFSEQMRRAPAEVIRHAVSGMLPKNKLRARRLTRLYIYTDNKHPYEEKFKVKDK